MAPDLTWPIRRKWPLTGKHGIWARDIKEASVAVLVCGPRDVNRHVISEGRSSAASRLRHNVVTSGCQLRSPGVAASGALCWEFPGGDSRDGAMHLDNELKWDESAEPKLANCTLTADVNKLEDNQKLTHCTEPLSKTDHSNRFLKSGDQESQLIW